VILEIGCGPGYLWLKNRDRLDAGWDITLSDFSPGMLKASRKNLGLTSFLLKFAVIDAGSIALPDGSVDVALANHMLYHVRDRETAIAEIVRVLKPGGRLFASTSGQDHLCELGNFCVALIPVWAVMRSEALRRRNSLWRTGGIN
jgi:ubiquinone/menaquinone biosynthesis C-methylase UbiE